MAKIAISTATYFADAIIDLLSDAGYDTYDANGGHEFILVNTSKQTAKDGNLSGNRQVLCPTTQWAAIAALVSAADGGAQAAAPVATSFRVGDRVTAVNTDTTKDKFRLIEGYRYVVHAITPSGKLNLGGEHDYLASRFTAVAQTTNYFDIVVGTPASAPVALPTPAAMNPVDAAGNVLAVGDTVLVTVPAGKKPKNPELPDNTFDLRPNGVALITRITAKGGLGFAFDEDNEFLSKRFQKVTLTQVDEYGQHDPYGDQYPQNVRSGALVVARPGRHRRNADNASKFALPTDTALVFRGVTLDKGNFIMDGYAEHQYVPSRFSVVTPVIAN